MNKLLFFLFFIFISCNQRKLNNTANSIDSVGFFLNKIKKDSSLSFNEKSYVLKKAYTNLLKGEDSISNNSIGNLAYELFSYQKLKEFKTVCFVLQRKSIQQSDSTNIALSCRFLGGYYREICKPDSSFYYYVNAEKLYLKLNKKDDYANILLNKGILQSMVNDIYGADYSLKSAYNIYKQNKDPIKTQQILNELGLIQKKLENYDKSISYFKQSYNLIVRENIQNPLYLKAICYNNIGLVYMLKKNYSESNNYFKKSLYAFNKSTGLKNPLIYASIIDNLAISNLHMNNLKSFPNQFFLALKIRDSLKNTTSIITSYSNLSRYFNKIGDKQKSILYSYKAIRLARKNKGAIELIGALQQASEVDTQNALKYTEEYIRINDSLQLLERKSKDLFARIQLETEVIKQEKNEALKKNQLTILLATISVLVLLLLFLVYRQLSSKKQLQLKHQQQQTQEELYNLIIQQQALEDATRKKEQNRIALELHDNVMNKLAATRFNLFQYIQDSQNEFQEIARDQADTLFVVENELRAIAHNLSKPEDFTKNNDFFQLIQVLVNQYSTLQVDLHINPAIDWNSQNNTLKLTIYRILQESLHNIQKHAQASLVTISIEQDFDNIALSIIDNGVGFHINEKTTGIGLQNIKHRVQALSGKINIDSTLGKGTAINIAIPMLQNH